jgi:hypothetical protein
VVLTDSGDEVLACEGEQSAQDSHIQCKRLPRRDDPCKISSKNFEHACLSSEKPQVREKKDFLGGKKTLIKRGFHCRCLVDVR